MVMGKKLSYNYVKDFFEKEGYKLLSEKYEGGNTTVKVMCPLGHEYRVNFASFKKGHRCLKCIIEDNYNEVIFQLEKEGYTILSKNIKKSYEKIKLRCPKGHIFKSVRDDLKKGARCKQCVADNLRHAYNFIKNEFAKEGYILLSKEYKESHKLLTIECFNGHQHQISYSAFQQGQRCGVCYKLNNYGENANNWKGGISTLASYFRKRIDKWIQASLNFYNHQCFITGKIERLVVHHPINFRTILREVLKSLSFHKLKLKDYSDIELKQIGKMLLKLHFKYGYGVPLCTHVHDLFHRKYGTYNNTWEQLLEFKQSYDLKEVVK